MVECNNMQKEERTIPARIDPGHPDVLRERIAVVRRGLLSASAADRSVGWIKECDYGLQALVDIEKYVEQLERERDEAVRVRDLAREASSRDLQAKREAEAGRDAALAHVVRLREALEDAGEELQALQARLAHDPREDYDPASNTCVGRIRDALNATAPTVCSDKSAAARKGLT